MYVNGAACLQIPETQLRHPTVVRIEGFLQYPDGWSNGEGRRFAKQTVEVALRLHRRLLQRGLMHTSASAGLDGEILVTAYLRDGRCIELFAEQDGRVTFAVARGPEYLRYEEDLDETEISDRINAVGHGACRSSESSTTQSTSISTRGASRAQLLEATTGFSPCLTRSARSLSHPDPQYVGT